MIAKVIPHAVDLLLDTKQNVNITHEKMQNSSLHYNCPHKRSQGSLDFENVAGRLRESPFPMITIEESMKMIKKSVMKNVFSEKVGIWDSHGRVLSETVYSPCNLPPFRASIKDGYAVIASDGKGKRRVLAGIEAGQEVRTRYN